MRYWQFIESLLYELQLETLTEVTTEGSTSGRIWRTEANASSNETYHQPMPHWPKNTSLSGSRLACTGSSSSSEARSTITTWPSRSVYVTTIRKHSKKSHDCDAFQVSFAANRVDQEQSASHHRREERLHPVEGTSGPVLEKLRTCKRHSIRNCVSLWFLDVWTRWCQGFEVPVVSPWQSRILDPTCGHCGVMPMVHRLHIRINLFQKGNKSLKVYPNRPFHKRNLRYYSCNFPRKANSLYTNNKREMLTTEEDEWYGRYGRFWSLRLWGRWLYVLQTIMLTW